MTALISHPLTADEEVSDARLERALKTLAGIIKEHGSGPMPIFERLEAEFERRRQREARLNRFLENN